MLTPVQADARDIIVGQPLKVGAEFRVEGEPKDPTVLYFHAKSPSGVRSTRAKVDLLSAEVGYWYTVVVADEPGWWAFRFEGSGVADGVQEIEVYVRPSAF